MTQEEFVRRIRACGRAIIDHVEDIANKLREKNMKKKTMRFMGIMSKMGVKMDISRLNP